MSCGQKYGWRLEQLTRLLKDGAITQEQYDKKDLQNKLQFLQDESSSPSASPSKVHQTTEEEKVIVRLNKYATCELALHRFSLVRELLDYASQMGPSNSIAHLPQVLTILARDQETLIRQGVAEQIPELSTFLFEKVGNKEDIFLFVAEKFFPVLTELLQDAQAIQVRETALSALLELVPKFSVPHIKQFIIPILDMFAQDENDEDNRVQAAGILNEIAPTMGPELTIKHGIPILAMLVDDPTFRVRKAAASSLNLIASTIGIEQTTKLLLPIYLELAKDEIWGVRKACADSLAGVSSFLTYEKRTEELVPLYELLAEDKSRWVRSSAREALGPFIATYGENSQVPEILINHFRSLSVREPVEDQTEQNDADHPTFCAFNFPAVLITLGAERWPELKDTYTVLVKDQQWKVRRTLSFSLHAVAEILGRKITEETLLPTFELFLRDLDEVKVGVIKNFSKFIKILSPMIRKNYLFVLEELKEPKVNWRFRRLITKQLGELAELYDAHNLETTVLPLALKLQLDPVAAVRKALYGQLGIVINCLSATNGAAPPAGSEVGTVPFVPASPPAVATLTETAALDESRNQFFNFVKDLAKHDSYRNRLTFCELCGSSVGVLEKHIFEEIFFQPLIKLVSDKVPNVRVAVASALKKIKEKEQFKDDEQIAQALEKLKQDKDREVVVTVGGVPPLLKKTRKNISNQ